MRFAILTMQKYLIYRILLIGIMAAGCSLSQPSSLKLSAPNIQSQQVLNEVPFFPQEDYQCGPAALATVLGNEGVLVKPGDLVSKVYLPARKGSLQIEMLAASRAFDRIPYLVEHSLESLIQQLSAGKPVLILQNLALNWYPKWHYAVVIGYDLKERVFYLRSGTHKRIQIPFGTLEKTWARAQYWGFVVLNPDETPIEPNYNKYLRAIHQLELTGRYKAASTGYQTAHQLWPERTGPLFALGNVFYQVKDYQQAVSVFNKVLKMDPESGQAWNNLAYVFKALNCPGEALIAIQKALHLEPENAVYQSSYDELSRMKATPFGFFPQRCQVKFR